jgi:hypothetical protein
MSTQQQVGKPAQAGKGSRPRPVRGSTYRQRYAAIRWKKKRSAVSSQRSALNSKPSTLHPQPSTLNRVHQ